MIRRILLACTVLGCAALAGCGFHLEGRMVLPATMRRPYIRASDQQSDFVQSLRRDLLISGAHPTEDETNATAVIDVHGQVKRSVLSVSATNRPTEYQVTYSVRVSVTSQGKTLLADEHLKATRSYTFNETQLLATEHEQAILTGAMGRELADIVMRRLARL